ncbi:helix-turn-helix transcriptional regulator [Streptomyces sp. ISL-96]|uniref:helix-turn-helix domain-containing protein n=1 Tax=Streptomyces sp. ISL-96 TaxID=2819191 RepID=UPI0027E2AC83|nr:helix-turn-helix transcriptional regulator [Streptomyces sp. ISL-96]
MGRRKDLDASLSVPSFYGGELRWQREREGLTLADVVEGSFYSPTLLSEIELGNRRMPQDLAQHVDRVLKTDGFFERRCEDVRRARRGAHAEYFLNTLELEKRAQEIDDWAPMLVPGLLQTGAYARAVIEAAHPMQQPDEVDAKISARLQRAQLFDDPKAPEFWCVLHESLLRQPIIDDEAMADQLESIVALTRRRRIVPQVVPWNTGAHPFMMGMTRLMTFDECHQRYPWR